MTTSTSAAPTIPLGKRPPGNPALVRWLIRLALCGVALVLANAAAIRAWGAGLVAGDARLQSIGQITGALTAPRVLTLFTVVIGAALLVLALELVRAAWLLVQQIRAARAVRGQYLRIRVPATVQRGGAATSGTVGHSGVDLFRALHAVLPMTHDLTGRAPWVTLTLVGRPNEPVELGAYVTDGGQPRKGATYAAALREIVVGQAPDSLVEATSDPLAAVATPGHLLAWRDMVLAQPPTYPLRLADDIERTDLLGPLVAALRPGAGVLQTEAQIIMRPRLDMPLNAGWRALAMRRLLRMQASNDYAIKADAAAIEAKLGGPAYDVTIRLLAVAQADARAAAIAELDEAAAVIGQYNARSGARLQRLRTGGGGVIRIRKTEPAPRAALRGYLAAAALALVSAGLLLAATRLTPAPTVIVPSATFAARCGATGASGIAACIAAAPAQIQAALPHALALCVAVLAGLISARYVQQRHDIPAWVRVRRLLTRAPRANPPAPWLGPGQPWRPAAILGPTELAGLWHLPSAALGALVRWLPCRHIAAPPHAFVPAALAGAGATSPMRLVVGHARQSDGTLAAVGPTLRDCRQIVHITAGMGAGKSRLLANVCQQLFTTGFVLIDGKGDDAGNLTTTVRNLIPLDLEGQVRIIDVLDMDWPIGLNPLAGIDLAMTGAEDLALGQISAIFARLDPETWVKAPTMKELLEMSMRLVIAGEPRPTLAHGKQALLDADYRARLLPHVRNPEVLSYWTQIFPETGEAVKTSLQALFRRFGMVLTPELTRYLITQERPTMRFDDAIANRQIVLIPVPHVTLGQLAGAVGMLVFQSFMRSAFTRSGSDQSRADYPLIVDEFQVLVENGDTTDVQNAVTQLRALGIPAFYAHQALSQLKEATELMLINAENRIVLRTQEPDASMYARHYAAHGISAADVSGQEPLEHQYAALRCDGKPTGPFSIRPLMWPTPTPDTMPALDGPAWQRVLPADSDAADPYILALVYAPPAQLHGAAQQLADLDADAWQQLNTRWDAIRDVQRGYILANPGCIPDRSARLRWLSRLAIARPRVLAAAEYARIRRITGDTTPAPVAPPRRSARAERSGVPAGAPGAAHIGAASYVPGVTPSVAPPPPVMGVGPSAEDALAARGRRPTGDDLIAPGFEGLDDLEPGARVVDGG